MIVEFVMSVDDDMIPTLVFPNPMTETVEGVIGYGGKLSAANLVEAYRQGIFPWPHEGFPLLWFCPDQRGVIDFKDLHLPSSFKKWMRRHSGWSWTWNESFEKVIEQCQQQRRPGQSGTWITSDIIRAYTELHRRGFAYSLEIWNEEKELVGGIYGVLVNGYFSGESMFHKKTNASKLALYRLIERLQVEGHQWMDIQMVTSVSEQFGGRLISKEEFLSRLSK